MTMKTGLWRVDGDSPARLQPSQLPMEQWLEDYVVAEPELVEPTLLIIGRQVQTTHGGRIDLLGMDVEGSLHVLELKRDRTPRDVVAQALDYGQWVAELDRDQILDIAQGFLKGPLETAFYEKFGETLPDELNAEHHLVVMASALDASSERIISYLRDRGVPINALFFTHFQDGDRRYLARTWLSNQEDETPASSRKRPSKKAEWNGIDWFASFGDEPGGRAWADGLRYGFVSAGGGKWYTQSLRNVPPGARLNVHLPQRGYVAVGEALASASRLRDTSVEVDGELVPLSSRDLKGTYTDGVDDDAAEWFIPVRWLVAHPSSEAYWETGMFANQNSACKLRQEFTLQRLAEHFHLDATG